MASDDFDAQTLTSFLDDEDTVSTLSAITVDDREPALPMRQFLFNNGDFADDTYRAYIRALPKPFNQFPADVEVEKLRILIEEGAVTFAASSFSFLEGKGDLQVLFVAGNIDRYFVEVEKFPLDDEFREKLLSTEIGDDKKLKLIDDMDMTLLASAPNRAAVVGQIFHQTGADLSHLSAEAAQAVVTNSKPIKAQISLLNKCHAALSDDQIRATISHLPPPFSEIEPGWRQPTIPDTPENQDFVRWLESRSIISSSKPTFFGDEIRIYNKRK
ncbi:MAG: hypothetical protein H6892_07115 [Brucellaceae bacterium]|nr:hypothetical protein [Brucellaceae bacterium]